MALLPIIEMPSVNWPSITWLNTWVPELELHAGKEYLAPTGTSVTIETVAMAEMDTDLDITDIEIGLQCTCSNIMLYGKNAVV